MNEQQPADEAEFARALGLNPDEVRAGSIHVEFIHNAGAMVRWEGQKVIPAQQAGIAFLRSSGMQVHEESDNAEKEPTT